uniref:Midasin n=1 Tax=Romanomermis culicivorax TaxID=13658 RepID=A0A915IPF4_ROMCU
MESCSAHKDFRLFACMNPSTDVGKRELIPALRNRFTEIYVEELNSVEDLCIVIDEYLRGIPLSNDPSKRSDKILEIVKFYLAAKSTAKTRLKSDSWGHFPNYRSYPVLLQGETSVGKTSLIKFLAQLTGNKFIRINNHEHTDIQEYIGSYVTQNNGKLVFVEGPLVKAMREGFWIILDELNLAPPDVLEALNRVLDHNRELFIAETQEVVKAHPSFMLFATQNPYGLYGGRKQLSRAFRNRFIELHFSELPCSELEYILHMRCSLPPSYAKKMVKTMQDLQIHRNTAGVFAGRESYMTLRDLFRWGERYRLANLSKSEKSTFHDWDQYLVDQGYFLLAGRCRRADDHDTVCYVLKKCFAREIDIKWLFSSKSPYLLLSDNVLRDEAADFVGRISSANLEKLQDGILFEWKDGPLVISMKNGEPLLIDEISLADDSVLERINSVLEPEKTLLVSEMGDSTNQSIVAAHGFNVFATMNPGGDYGKKELSRALRNRFTEIWCESEYEKEDIVAIVEKSFNIEKDFSELSSGFSLGALIFDFIAWIKMYPSDGSKITVTIRDVISWVCFINRCASITGLKVAIVHGAFVTFLDGFGCSRNSGTTKVSRDKFCQSALRILVQLVNDNLTGKIVNAAQFDLKNLQLDRSKSGFFGIKPFYVTSNSLSISSEVKYCFDSPVCLSNIFKMLRALEAGKPILLEGSPGVGKSSVVVALAKVTGRNITRINLSEQTDLNDLFGSDVPVTMENNQQGFTWVDGPLLAAVKNGDWILIDEVFVDKLDAADLELILKSSFPTLGDDIIRKMVTFNGKINEEIMECHLWGHSGGPWEFNLRDLLRWASVMVNTNSTPLDSVNVFYFDRLRTLGDREQMIRCFEESFEHKYRMPYLDYAIGINYFSIGNIFLERNPNTNCPKDKSQESENVLLRSTLNPMRSLMHCIESKNLAILVGEPGSGKSILVENLAKICNRRLRTFYLTSDTDSSDLLGCFEQVLDGGCKKSLVKVVQSVSSLRLEFLRICFVNKNMDIVKMLLEDICDDESQNVDKTIENLKSVANKLGVCRRTKLKCDIILEV